MQRTRNVSNDEAQEHHCPRCRAIPIKPCRRVSDGWVMKTAHRERRDVALRARTLTTRERQQLVLWLLQHGRILWEEE